MQFAHVLLQVEVPAEPFAAYPAGERLFVVVRVHVEGQVVHLVERLVAHGTLICLFAAVRQLVVLVVAFLVETLAAELARKRFVAGVYARVRV